MPKNQIEQLHFNDEQTVAVNAGHGHWAVLAGPGSGKTAVLVGRYCALLAQGYSPEAILGVTFTDESAKEMRKRAALYAKVPETDRPSGFRTLHSLALAFATREHENFPYPLQPFPLATPGQSAKFLGDTARNHRLDFRKLGTWISARKREGVTPEQSRQMAFTAERFHYAEAYQDYDKKLRQAGLLDFDSLLLEMANLMRANPEVKERWQYRFVMTDESQDFSLDQWALIRLMSEKHGNVFSVGDANQCVYEWRAAAPELFLKFHEQFPNARYLFLGCNYRSTQKLVELFKEMAPIKNELIARFQSMRHEGQKETVLRYPTAQDEAEQVVKLVGKFGEKSSAILSRTNRNLRPYEDLLAESNIPYHVLGRAGFYAQEEIKNILALAQIAKYPSDAAVLRAIRAPFDYARFVRKKELIEALQRQKKGDPNEPSIFQLLLEYRAGDEHQQQAIAGLRSWLQGLSRYRNSTAGNAVHGILKDSGAVDYYAAEEASIENSPQENLEELARIANRFPSLGEFLDHSRKVTAASKVKKGVALSTIHGAKGREWENVYVIGASEGLLPHKNSENLAEEERLFFVAITRAAERLVITYAGQPSRFIKRYVTEPEAQAA